jgi:hypothetical protein
MPRKAASDNLSGFQFLKPVFYATKQPLKLQFLQIFLAQRLIDVLLNVAVFL